MKVGDIVEWKGLNKTHQGVIAQDEQGEFYVKMKDGHSFSLNDLRHSKSAILIEI